MFNLFKKKKLPNKLDPLETSFIEAITDSLAEKYPVFKKEVESGAFVGIGKNPGGSKGSYTYFIDNSIWKIYCDRSLNNYDIKNLRFKTYTGEDVNIDLFIMEGLIFGYKTNYDVKDIDVKTVDTAAIWEKHYLNKDYGEIEGIVSSLPMGQLEKLNMLRNTFRIEIDEAVYYPIHDIGDGNYFAVNKNGSVFKITHDPFEVENLSPTLIDFLNHDFK